MAVRDREPETISVDRQKEVLEDLRRWLLASPSLRESDQPPHDVRERMLLVVNRVCDFRMPKLKPRGRAPLERRGAFSCRRQTASTKPTLTAWSDAAVCVDYDAGHDKVRVYHLETGTMEFINMDAVPVRLGYATPYMKEMFDKKGRPWVREQIGAGQRSVRKSVASHRDLHRMLARPHRRRGRAFVRRRRENHVTSPTPRSDMSPNSTANGKPVYLKQRKRTRMRMRKRKSSSRPPINPSRNRPKTTTKRPPPPSSSTTFPRPDKIGGVDE